MKLHILLALSLFSLLPIAVLAGGMQDMDPLAQLESEAENLEKEVHNEIGDASCEQDSQCAALPMGHRACGGPAYYLAFSLKNTDETKLKKLARRHTQLHREINRIKEVISICQFLTPPPVKCDKGKCRL